MSEFIKMKLSEARAKFENLDEISKETMGSYVNKAAERIGTKGVSAGLRIAADEKSSANFKDMGKRQKGIAMAVKKLAKEEADQIDELSTNTLDSYRSKARTAIINTRNKGDDDGKTEKRLRGYTKASQKITRNFVKGVDEEVENLDEISKATMGRYINKAKDSIDMASYRQGNREARDLGGTLKSLEKKLSKRHKGIETAVKKLTKEEAEELEELSKGTLNSYVIKSLAPSSEKSISNLASKGGFEQGERGDTDPSAGEKEDAKSVKRSLGVLTAVRKLAKEESEGCMTNTSMGGADQIAQSKVGEIYKKSNKKVDAMNTTAVNKRVPAVESAVLDVMTKTFEKRKMFEDASNISIISPEQRQDWLNVSTGNMEVVDYFNKYKV